MVRHAACRQAVRPCRPLSPADRAESNWTRRRLAASWVEAQRIAGGQAWDDAVGKVVGHPPIVALPEALAKGRRYIGQKALAAPPYLSRRRVLKPLTNATMFRGHPRPDAVYVSMKENTISESFKPKCAAMSGMARSLEAWGRLAAIWRFEMAASGGF